MARGGYTVEGAFLYPSQVDGQVPLTQLDRYDTIEFQIISASGGPWTPARRFSPEPGTTNPWQPGNWDPTTIYDQAAADFNSITVDHVGKIFSCDARVDFVFLPTNSTTDKLVIAYRAS